MKKLQEINKAMTASAIRDYQIVRCWSGDNLLKHDDKDLLSLLDGIRKRGNGVALLLIEKR